MIDTEWRKAGLHKVVETTLDEYVEECSQMNHRVDKCGYINQILDKVAVEGKQRSKG